MSPLSRRAPRALLAACCALPLQACNVGDDDPPWDPDPRIEATVGPQGGALEVKGTGTELDGIRIDVPAGAVAGPTTFSVEYASNPPDLPGGLSFDHPAIQLEPAASFAKDVLLTLPVSYVPPADSRAILGAYCFHDAKGRWGVIPARRVVGGAAIEVATHGLGLCRWGTIRLDAVDDATLRAWADDLQGVADDWETLRALLLAHVAPLEDVVDSGITTQCASQQRVLDWLVACHADAQAGVAAYLTSPAVVAACRICDRDGSCQDAVCDPDLVTGGQPLIWLTEELRIWWQSLIISSACPVDALAPLVEKVVAWAKYQDAIRELSCDWRCVVQHGTPEFWDDLLSGNLCAFAGLAVELYQREHPCQ